MKTLAFFILWSGIAFAQNASLNSADAIRNYLPTNSKQSPEAAAFTRITEIPVSHYTGIPNISIPLYTLQTQSLSASVGINYHASGVKVEDEATQVGLGWSLDAGGMISRSIRGRDDFDGILRQGDIEQNVMNGLLMPNYEPPVTSYTKKIDRSDVLGFPVTSLILFCGSNASSNNPLYASAKTLANRSSNNLDLGKSRLDSQYDIFNFQAGGYSGKFIITRHQSPYKIYVLSQEPIVINLLDANGSGIINPDLTGQSGFRVTTPDGNQYYYSTTELSRSVGGVSRCGKIVAPDENPNSGLSATKNGAYGLAWDYPLGDGAGNTNIKPFISSWHLSKIVSGTNENDVIYFDYFKTTNLVTLPLPSRSQNITTTNNGSTTWRITDTRQQIVFLTKIRSAYGSISFNRSDRNDMRAGQGFAHQKLDKVVVNDSDNQQLMAYQFNYSYFDSGDASQLDHVRKRLRLDNLTELGQDNTAKPPYIFSYFDKITAVGVEIPTNLPNKNSYAQDFWGCYNGEETNNTKINITTGIGNTLPELNGTMVSIQFPNAPSVNAWGFNNPANRTPNLDFAKLGTLETMKYPTGGLLKLEYEFHEFNNYLTVEIPNSIVVSDLAFRPIIKGVGLRIAQTKMYADPSVTTKYLSKKYLYLGSSVMESGKLMYDASFSYFISYDGGPGQVFTSTSRHGFSQSANGSPIGYSKVRELQYNSETNSTNNGYIDYEFENKVDRRYDQFCFPADWNYGDCNLPSPFSDALPCSFFEPIFGANGMGGSNGQSGIYYNQVVVQDGSIPNSFSQKNGALLSKRVYTAANQLQEEEINTFSSPIRTQIPVFNAIGRAGIVENFPALFKYYVNLEWTRLDSKTTTSYPANDNNAITNTVNYTYSPVHHQTTEVATTNSRLEVIKSQTKYPNDYAAGANIYQLMVQRNMITPVVTQIELNQTKNVEVARVQNDFFNFGFNPGPLIFVRTTTKTFGGTASAIPDATFKYNLFGNLVEIMPRSAVPMSFVWGYNNKYPVAQIEGMTDAQTQSAIAGAGLNQASFQTIAGATQAQRDADLNGKLLALRNTILATVPIAQMTGYTYKGLVGKTTQSAPNKLMTTFNYDIFNRLDNITNPKGEVVKSYKYNYRP